MATYGGSAPIFGRHSVASEKTTVVTRRVAQYIVDVIANGVLSAIPFLLLVAASTDSAGNVEGGTATSVLYAIAIVLALAVSVWYWVLRPAAHRGRTFGMALMRIRVVDADTAGEARKGQLVIRWILLIVDTLFAGLVGLITMLVSKRHQRVGDMGAHTLVVRDRAHACTELETRNATPRPGGHPRGDSRTGGLLPHERATPGAARPRPASLAESVS